MMRRGPLLADRYELGSQLGTGGMGTVYLARDRLLGRPVAVKLLSPAAAAPDAVARFDQEARTAALLAHPNVVTVFDHGADPGTGSHYLVMEYVQGPTLAQVLAGRGPLPPAEAARIARQVCQALGAAHRAGLVHHDIKPGNILLDPAGRVKVTDFGLASANSAPVRRVDGEPVWGTAAYLSPEQARGLPTDARSDVYALGCVLYELLTGTPPFAGDPAALAWQHVSRTPEPPSVRHPGIGKALDAVVMTALAKQPDERYPSALAMAMALADTGVLAEPKAAPVPPAGAARDDGAADPVRPTVPLPRHTAVVAAPPAPGRARARAAPRRHDGSGRSLAWAWWLLLGLLAVTGGVVVALLLRVDGSPQGDGRSTAAPPSVPPFGTVAPTTTPPSTSEPSSTSTTRRPPTTAAPEAGGVQAALAGLAETLAAGRRAGTVDGSAGNLLREAQDLVRATQDQGGGGKDAAKKLRDLARKTDELIAKGKIVEPSASQVRDAVARLGAALGSG
jgi:hypothetical protein